MKHIFNTNFYSMRNDRSVQWDQRPSRDFVDAMLHTLGENDLVVGDPTDFNIKDEINDFDHGWDLDDDDAFLIMR